MGRRHFIQPFNILDNVDISQDQTSQFSDVSLVDVLTYLLEWSGDADGEIFVDVKNNKEDTNIHTLNFGSVIGIDNSQNPQQHILVIDIKGFKFMRLRYVSNSGSGNLTATMFATAKGA